LIATDSTNPPGGEAAVVAVVGEFLRRHGLRPEIPEVLPGRPKLSVSIGAGNGPVLPAIPAARTARTRYP